MDGSRRRWWLAVSFLALSGIAVALILVRGPASVAPEDVGIVDGPVETSTSPVAIDQSTSTVPVEQSVPVALPDPQFQPAPPIRAAFFYPWFPEAWTQSGISPYTNFHPSFGQYDSSDPEVLAKQVELAASAGVQAFITSWWGPGHHTDAALHEIFATSVGAGSTAPDLRWAIYYEKEGQSDPTVADLVADLEYLAAEFFDDAAYLRVDGRPVVFVWATDDEPDMTTRWAAAKEQFDGNLYVVLKVFPGYQDAQPQPDSWHQYAPATAYSEQLPYSVTVSPGFHKVGETPRLERDLDRFSGDVARMLASGATWQLITSWNEWGEGTSIEPAEEWGTTYLDVLAGHVPVTASTIADAQTGDGRTVMFATGGDIGATEETTATLELVRAANPDFFLALGDLSYNDLEPESAWCDYMTAQLGPEIPVELVVGNHEDDDRVDGWIGAFAECLPDRMGMIGAYPAQYFFDVDGLVRVVVLGADNTVDGTEFDYREGFPEYEWLGAAIDGARDAAIPWVVVAMHKTCISVGRKNCEVGRDLVGLLTEKHVDLVLHAHDHTYQRSHQLRCATPDRFAESCVADDGNDGTYQQGAGTVFVVSGATGGGSLYDTDENDSEAGYMVTWMGGDDELAGQGFVLVNVSADELTAEFIGSTTEFADAFSIVR